MIVDVAIYADEAASDRVSGRSAAVIDVFRAISVVVEALHNGARAVVSVVTVPEAESLCGRYRRSNVILGSERDTTLIEGFDKDNSPLSYGRGDVEGKTVIMTTTNGTRAIYNSRFAGHIFVAAFLNMSAVCRRLAAAGKDIILICSGRENTFTAEDGLCAGAMAGILEGSYGCGLTDIAMVMRDTYTAAGDDLGKALSATRHYNHILSRGYIADINFCLQRDIYDIVPVYNEHGEITL